MSFAGTPSRSPGGRPRGTSTLGDAVRGVSSFAARLSGGAARRGAPDLEEGGEARVGGARPAPSRRSTRELESSAASDLDWGRVGAFGAGIALGALIGASTALLYAPQSGRATRAVIRRRARYFSSSAGDVWDDLGRELRGAARRSRRGVTRSVTRGRWKAADLLDA